MNDPTVHIRNLCGDQLGMIVTDRPAGVGNVQFRGGRCSTRIVFQDHLGWIAIRRDEASIKQNAPVAQRRNGRHVVADEQDRASARGNFSHSSEAFLLKFDVADRQHFIYDEDLRLQMCRN